MVRIATIDDLDICSRMALEFIRKTAYALFYDEGRVVALVKEFLQSNPSEKVILLWEDKGMLAGAKVPFIFGTDTMATEVGWWVDPSHRGTKVGLELLKAFEYWATKTGCKFITMVSIDDSLDKFYEKNEYKLYERAFLKVL